MKQLISFFLFISLVSITSVTSFAHGFEGTISMEATVPQSAGQPVPITISTKGEKTLMAITMPMGSMKIIMDRASGKMTTIMGQNGMEMDMNSDAIKNKKSDPGDTKVTATGEKKVINGHKCELIIITSKDNEVNMWATSELPASMLDAIKTSFRGGMQALSPRGKSGEGLEEIFKKGLLPIQMEVKKDGKVNATITLINFEEKKLPDSVFQIPSDVQIMQIPSGAGR